MRATDLMVDSSGKPLDGLHHSQPRLIAGETKQAFLTSKFKGGRIDEKPLLQRMSMMRLKQILRCVQFFGGVFRIVKFDGTVMPAQYICPSIWETKS
jgi:hypothetical protein